MIWKPSDKTPLTALACAALFDAPPPTPTRPTDLMQVVLGGADVGAALAAHEGVPVVSATGSTAMGRKVAPVVAARFGRSILELGGNNAAIVAPSADLDLAVRGIVFSAAGTAGQRCTTLRRLIVHRSIHDELVERIGKAYESLPIGNPLDDGTLVGPLIDAGSFERMQRSRRAGGRRRRLRTWPAANERSPTRPRTRSTPDRRSSRCPARPTSCGPRRSPRSCTR